MVDCMQLVTFFTLPLIETVVLLLYILSLEQQIQSSGCDSVNSVRHHEAFLAKQNKPAKSQAEQIHQEAFLSKQHL